MALDSMRMFTFRDTCYNGEMAATTAIAIAKLCLLLLLLNQMRHLIGCRNPECEGSVKEQRLHGRE